MYLVMKCHRTVPPDVQGIFSTEEKAIVACRDYNYCYRPFNIDEELPKKSTFDGWIFPKCN